MAEFDITAIFKVSGIAQLNASFKQISSAANTLGRDLQAVGRNANLFARNLAIVGGVAAASLGKAVQSSKEFEAGFANVVTLLDETSFATKSFEEGVSDLREGVIQLRKESGQSFEVLNQGLFDLISAGVDADTAISALRDASDLAVSGATNVASSVKALTATLTAFGSETITTQEIQEKFFVAQKFGVTTVEELGVEFNKVGGLAKVLGISFDETLAAAAALTANGAKPTSEAFTELRGIMVAVIQAQERSVNFSQEVQDSLALENIKRVGLVKAIQDTSAALDGDVVAQRKLFGRVQALSAAISLSGEQADLFATIMNALTDETGRAATASQALATQQATLEFQQKRLGGVIEATAVSIGGSLTPPLIALIDIFTTLLDTLGPEIEAFFAELGVQILAFVNSIKGDIPATVETIRSAADGIVQAFKAIGSALLIVVDLFNVFLDLMGAVAAIIPGVSKETLAFTVIFLQLTGGLRLITSLFVAFISTLRLLRAVLIATGVTQSAFFVAALAGFRQLAVAAGAAVVRVVASVVAMTASLTTLGGVLAAVRTAATLFWVAITGPVGIVVAIVAGIALIVAKLIGFEKIVNAIKGAWDRIVNVVKKAGEFVSKLFGGSDKKEIDININRSETTSNIPGLAGGGHVRGKGTSTSDSIAANLSDGEYVVKASSVKKFGAGVFDMLNNGVFPAIKGFADGGLVEALNSSVSRAGVTTAIPQLNASSSSPAKIGRPLNLILPTGEIIRATTDETTAQKLQKNLRRADNAKASELPNWY